MNYLNRELAINIDKILINKYSWDIKGLIEIAGFNLAYTIYNGITNLKDTNNILMLIGNGNNGNDCLVAAKYLKIFSNNKYNIDLLFTSDKIDIIRENILKNLLSHSVNYSYFSKDFSINGNTYDFIIDGLLGFSYKAPLRDPHNYLINNFLVNFEDKIISVDVPSGWEIDNEVQDLKYTPEYNISIMIPKICTKNYPKKHFLTGNFIPKGLKEEFNLKDYIYNNNMYITINN